jgi:hydrogenase maturation protein HypF
VAVGNVVGIPLRIKGIVQGAGFRPFVYSLTTQLGLSGFVLNDPEGVAIEVEGPSDAVRRFGLRLQADPPSLAAMESIDEARLLAVGTTSFEIRVSNGGGEARSPVASDVATCDGWLLEIETPGARRYRYPFTNCTDCGPRFTNTTAIPLRPRRASSA